MSDVVYEQAHKFVLLNHPVMMKWVGRYDEAVEGTSSMVPYRHWVRGAVLQAMNRGDYVSQETLDLTAGPQ
jgi:hypothetical protein